MKEPPKPRFDELTVTENSVIGIHLDSTVSSDTAKVEDKVTARVSRDVLVSGRTAIPAGSKLEGNVTLVERGGKFKDKARLGIRFTTLVLPDNTRQTIQTDALFRDGESPTGEATAKVGASAAVGAIIGAAIAREERRGDRIHGGRRGRRRRGPGRRTQRRGVCSRHAAHAEAHSADHRAGGAKSGPLGCRTTGTTGTSGTTGPGTR